MKTNFKFILLVLTSFILNLIWEFSHYSLYIDLSGISPIPHLILASVTDAIYISIFFVIVSIRNKNISWINKPKKNDYFIVISFGLITAAIIELINLNLGRWAYKAAMPTIFGIGISPLLQLATTAILSLLLISFLKDFS